MKISYEVYQVTADQSGNDDAAILKYHNSYATEKSAELFIEDHLKVDQTPLTILKIYY